MTPKPSILVIYTGGTIGSAPSDPSDPDSPLAAAPWGEIKSSCIYDEAVEQHIERIIQDFPSSLKLKVVVDCDCGAASGVTPRLLKKLGCEVTALNCYSSGFFPHPIEPIEANLGDLIKATRQL